MKKLQKIILILLCVLSSLWYSSWVDAGHPILDGMKNSSDPFPEEIKIDTKITKEDARGHQH